MSDPTFTWTPRSPLADAVAGSSAAPGASAAPGVSAPAGQSAAAGPTAGPCVGVSAVVRDGLGLATVLARKGAAAALTARVHERFGIDLPGGPRRSTSAGVAFAGTGPGAWLAVAERGGNEFAEALTRELDGLASVSDQSDGYALVRLTGSRVRDALAKLVPIDVHARAFEVGAAAATVASHIGVTLWRLEDEAGAGAVFEVVMFRSLAASFWHALAEAGAEFGFAARLPC